MWGSRAVRHVACNGITIEEWKVSKVHKGRGGTVFVWEKDLHLDSDWSHQCQREQHCSVIKLMFLLSTCLSRTLYCCTVGHLCDHSESRCRSSSHTNTVPPLPLCTLLTFHSSICDAIARNVPHCPAAPHCSLFSTLFVVITLC